MFNVAVFMGDERLTNPVIFTAENTHHSEAGSQKEGLNRSMFRKLRHLSFSAFH